MYELVSCKDKFGNDKLGFIEELRISHPDGLFGEQIYYEFFKNRYNEGQQCCFCFLWNDDRNKMLRTSRVLNFIENKNSIEIETKNSCYVFKRVEEKINYKEKADYSNICSMNDDEEELCWSCTNFNFPIGCMKGE